METQDLVRLLRLELECNHYAVNTVREYTRLVSLLLLVPLIRLYISTPRRQRHPPPPQGRGDRLRAWLNPITASRHEVEALNDQVARDLLF